MPVMDFIYWIFLPVYNACICVALLLLYAVKRRKDLLYFCMLMGAYLCSSLFSLYYVMYLGVRVYPHVPDVIRLFLVDSVVAYAYYKIVCSQAQISPSRKERLIIFSFCAVVMVIGVFSQFDQLKKVALTLLYVWGAVRLYRARGAGRNAVHMLVISLLFIFSRVFLMLYSFGVLEIGVITYINQIIRIYMCVGKIYLVFSQNGEPQLARAEGPDLQSTVPEAENKECEPEETNGVCSDFGLTKREAEILGLVSEGKSNRDISIELFLAENTVKRHLNNIYRKLGVTNRTQAAIAMKEKTNR